MTRSEISRHCLRQRIIDILREEIISGRIDEQCHLTERALANRFQISQVPIRECLIVLEKEGYVEIQPYRRTIVAAARPKSQSQDAVWNARTVIEVVALSLCSDTRDMGKLTPLRDHADKIKSACERRDVHDAQLEDFRFHQTIVELAPDPALLDVWRVLSGRARMDETIESNNSLRLTMISEQHCSIVEACERGAIAQASKLLVENLQFELGCPETTADSQPASQCTRQSC